MTDPEESLQWLKDTAVTTATADPDAATTAEPCAHVYASEHLPGHRVYWVSQCMLCHDVNWDELDREVDAKVAEAREAERQRIRQLAIDCKAIYVTWAPLVPPAVADFADLLEPPP